MGKNKKKDGDEGDEKKETSQIELQYRKTMQLQEQKQKLLKETEENDKELDIDCDTYTMAFMSLHWKSMKQLDLGITEVHDAVRSAIFVFLVQMTLIFILAIIITQNVDGFAILLP